MDDRPHPAKPFRGALRLVARHGPARHAAGRDGAVVVDQGPGFGRDRRPASASKRCGIVGVRIPRRRAADGLGRRLRDRHCEPERGRRARFSRPLLRTAGRRAHRGPFLDGARPRLACGNGSRDRRLGRAAAALPAHVARRQLARRSAGPSSGGKGRGRARHAAPRRDCSDPGQHRAVRVELLWAPAHRASCVDRLRDARRRAASRPDARARPCAPLRPPRPLARLGRRRVALVEPARMDRAPRSSKDRGTRLRRARAAYAWCGTTQLWKLPPLRCGGIERVCVPRAGPDLHDG